MVKHPAKAPSCYCPSTFALQTVISGSYRKHLNQIVKLKQALEKHHVAVLSPSGDLAINPDEEFIILDSDPVSHPKLLQDSIFAKIRRSTFLIVANVGGYLGRAAVLEIGYALAIGLTVYTTEPVTDPNIAPYCRSLNEIFPDIQIPAEDNIPDWEYAHQAAALDLDDLGALEDHSSHFHKNSPLKKIKGH